MRLALAAVVAIGCSSSATTSAPPSGSAAPATPRPPASLRDRVLAINGHVTVLKNAAFADYRDVVRSAMQIKGVTSAEPFIFSDATATSPSATAAVKLVVKGIDPAGVTKASISSFLRAGTLDFVASSELPPTVVLADGLAASLGAKVGDQITIAVERTTLDDSTWSPQSKPHPQMVRVGGIIHTEFDEYDRHLAYVTLATLQGMLDRGDTVMGIEVRVTDSERAAAIAAELDKTLGGPPYEARDWHSLSPGL